MSNKKQPPNNTTYHPTNITAATLPPNTLHKININGQKILLTRHAGQIHAIAAHCPHAAADLTKGTLHKGRIDCPEHNWRFDIQTGRTLYPPDETCRLKRYPTKIIAKQIWVAL